jgi:serine/threonine-protein kinase RsbW
MSQQQWIWRFDRVIPSETAASKQVLDEVLRALKAQHWLPHDVFGVHLAMHEALVNAILHGNRLAADKRVHVSCRMSPELISIEITDEGEGFNPVTLPDPTDPDRLESPGGRGVMLMKAFMSRVDFNERGNCVVMEKRRGGRDDNFPAGAKPPPSATPDYRSLPP